MTRKTKDEIQAEIAKLKEIRPLLAEKCPKTFFGDSNLDALDADLAVLEEGLSEDEIYERWWGVEYICYAALFTREWVEGAAHESEDSPAAWWLSLIVD
jgi:hypothetical protein